MSLIVSTSINPEAHMSYILLQEGQRNFRPWSGVLTPSLSRPSGVANQTDILVINQVPSRRNKQQAWRTGLDNVGLVWIQGSFKRRHEEGGGSSGGGDGTVFFYVVPEQFIVATKMLLETKTQWAMIKITM